MQYDEKKLLLKQQQFKSQHELINTRASLYSLIQDKLSKIDLNYLVIVLVAFSQGITGLSDLAINYLYKDDFKLEPAQVSRINSIVYLPWIVKPIYGFISDSFPILGYRRKPYLFIFGITATICWILMSLWVDTPNKVIIIMLGNQVSTAFCNVIGEALVVETSQKQKEADPEAGARNVSMFFFIKSCGSLLTAFSSGALLEYMDKRSVFLITSCFPIMVVVSAILLQEKKVGIYKSEGDITTPKNKSLANNTGYNTFDNDVQKNDNDEPNISHQIDLFLSFLKMEQIYKPVIFIFLYMITPSYGDPLFYFYTNVLNFSPMTMGRLKLIYGIASISGIALYNKYLKNVSFKRIIWYTTLLSMFFNMLSIILVNRLNLIVGIPDFWFCLTADALTTALAEINTMPLLVLACNICPKNIEGTLYAFLMSVVNLGSLFSNQFGAALTLLLGITNNRFDNLPWLILIANIVYLLPMPGLYLIDESTYASAAAFDNIKKDALENETLFNYEKNNAISLAIEEEEKTTIEYKIKFKKSS